MTGRLYKLSLLLFAAALPAAAAASTYGSPYPEEPERYDSEYHLDMLTMSFDRDLRSLWEGRDNAFRLALGSLNVEQWGLRESLKFSSRLSGRWRLRYWMRREGALDEDDLTRNEIEAEFNVGGDFFLSFVFGPYFWKRENDVGVGLQRRTALDRYLRLDFRVLDFANDFTYRKGERIEDEKNLYAEQPLEFSLVIRERIGEGFRFGLDCAATNRWKKEHRFLPDPASDYDESGYARYADVWVESRISRELLFDLDLRIAGYMTGIGMKGEREERHRVTEFTPRFWWYPGGTMLLPVFYSEGTWGASRKRGGLETPFTPSRRSAGAPRAGICAGVRARHEHWTGEGARAGDFKKDEIMPFLIFKYRLSTTHILEAGYIGDRYSSARTGMEAGSDDRWENRIRLVWELRFRGNNALRIIETIDLDREDWGQFSIHDHFFIMTQIAF